MKQVININFHGRVVPIEVSAFDVLKEYTASLNRFFANEDGKEEIINDIESRIGELFQERLKSGATCITDEDVNAIIRSMGRPEDFDTVESSATESAGTQQQAETDTSAEPGITVKARRLYRDENDKVFGGVCSGLANYFGIDKVVVRIIFIILAVSFGFGLIPYLILWIAVPSSATKEIGAVRKKLYRDSDDKIVAGVCSGIGNYFGINAWIPRVLFLLPFLSFATRWGNWGANYDFFDFVQVSFSPGALMAYIILWLVIPEALTTTEKLEMKGEKVDMNSIKNSVMEELKGVQHRAEKFGKEAGAIATEKTQAMGADIGRVAKRGGRSLGDVIAFLVKVFVYFILGCLVFAFVVALFSLGVVAIGLFPVKDFLLKDGWQNIFAWGTLIFFIAVPIIGIITWLIRKLARIRSNSKLMGFTFSGLWIIGWVCFTFLLASVTRDFKSGNNLYEEEIVLSNPAVDYLELTSVRPNQTVYRSNWFRLEPFENLDEDTAIVRNVRVQIIQSNTDSFRVVMNRMARGNTRRYADTLASLIQFNAVQQDSLLILDRGIPITRKDKFRNQRVIITVFVPVGKRVKVDRSAANWHNVQFDGPWDDDRDWEVETKDIQHGWDFGVEYIMKKDGLYTLGGQPANQWDREQKIIEDWDNSGKPDDADRYRYDNRGDNRGAADSVLMKQQLEKQRVKDSLRKVKEEAEAQLNRLEARTDRSPILQTSSIMSYSPMLMIYP